MREDLIAALRCCRDDDCEHCPVQKETCDELFVETVEIPVGLIDLIDAEETEKEGDGPFLRLCCSL